MSHPVRESRTLEILRNLHPNWTEEELVETEEHIALYFQIAWDIFNRLQTDPKLRERYERLKEEYRLLTSDEK